MAATAGSRRTAQGEESGPRPTLGDVIANLASEVLRVACVPDEGRVHVNDVAILDPADPHCVHAGAIVLGVGLSGSEGDAVTLVDAAGRRDAAAVVFRTDDELPPRIVEMAEAVGLALLTVPPEVTWGHLYSLVRTALVSAGAVEEPDPAGVSMGDLFALADAVAAAVGGPVTIEDPQFRVLAYSNLDQPIDEARRQTILGRTPPSVWQQRLEEAGVTQALRRKTGVVRFDGWEDEGLATRLTAPVRAGSELLGSIWVAEADAPLGHAAERALLRAAEIAAVHLLCNRASEDVKRRTRGAFVRELLEGRVPPSSAAVEVPLRAKGPFSVLAFELAAGESPLHACNPDRVLSVISLYCEDAHRDAMCALVDDRFWALLPTPPGDVRARTVELGTKIADRVESALHLRLVGAVGPSVPSVREVPRSRRAAERALEVLARRDGRARVVHIDDVGAHVELLELLDLAASRPGLAQGKLDAVLAYDREHGTGCAASLRAYLDCSRDVTGAAARLGVHPNTLRYRLRRVLELSGLDLDDPDERLVTELQLRLHR